MAGRNISYVKPKEPSFLRKFKNDVGFKEGPSVNTKRGPAMMPDPDDDDDDVEEKEDERPQVVILKDGDLTEEEARKLHGGASPFATDDRPADGRILFRKPAKRGAASPGNPKAGSKFGKRKRESERDGGRPKGDSAAAAAAASSSQAVKNASLLSFGEDEEGD